MCGPRLPHNWISLDAPDGGVADRDLVIQFPHEPIAHAAAHIPELGEAFWKNDVRGRFYKPTKTATTVRVDADVLAWLKGQGKGYQTRMNAILRRAMLADLDQRN